MIRRLLALALVNLATCLGYSPSAVEAQQPIAARHIGFVLVAFSPADKELQAFRSALSEAGYLEGRDVVIEWRLAGGDYAKVRQLVAELIQHKVEALVVESTLAARAAKEATSTIPIVMSLVGDPVGSGLVTSLAHPGGNITGLSLMTVDLSAKRLELLKEAVPQAKRVGILWNPDAPWHAKAVQDLQAVAPGMSIKLSAIAAREPGDFDAAFAAAKQAHLQAMYVLEAANYWSHRAALLSAVSKARIPVIYGQRDFAEAGGLMSYGTNFTNIFRRSIVNLFPAHASFEPLNIEDGIGMNRWPARGARRSFAMIALATPRAHDSAFNRCSLGCFFFWFWAEGNAQRCENGVALEPVVSPEFLVATQIRVPLLATCRERITHFGPHSGNT